MSILNIASSDISVMIQGIGELIQLGSVPCVIEYSPIQVPCPNQNLHGSSPAQDNANFYINGGVFNSLASCPDCGGTNYIMTAATETIYLSLDWEPKDYIKSQRIEVRVPYSIISARGFIKDFPKVQRANRLLVEAPIEGYTKFNFKLRSESIDENSIFAGHFFTSYWERT